MRVSIVEAHDHVRAALCFILAAQPDLQLVGAFRPTPDLIALLVALRPDVVLLDWELPGEFTWRFLVAARRTPTPPRIIVLSTRTDDEPRARAAGADAFVSKSDPPEALMQLLSNLSVVADNQNIQ